MPVVMQAEIVAVMVAVEVVGVMVGAMAAVAVVETHINHSNPLILDYWGNDA